MTDDNQQPNSPQPPAPPTHTGAPFIRRALPWLVFVLIGSNVATYFALNNRVDEAGRIGVQRQGAALGDFQVVNAHEHLYKISHVEKYLKAARKMGVRRTIFVASSGLTLLGSKGKRDELNDWNTEEILKCAKVYGDEVIPFCTVHPDDPQKVEKVKDWVARGVRGLKLYTGHSNFHDRPLDAPEMKGLYAYCEEVGLPIIWHVRLDSFAKEFERVMAEFPNLKVIMPHYGVAFFRPKSAHFANLERLLDTYPNLYVDTSFGTRAILVHGLEMFTKHNDIFRQFFLDHSDKIVFGTDMVVTGNSEKTPNWVESVIRACRDGLEKDGYTFFMAAKGSRYTLKSADNAYGQLRGLHLPDEVLRKVYETNIQRILSQ